MKTKFVSEDDNTLTLVVHSPNERNKVLMQDAGKMQIKSYMLKDGALVFEFEPKPMKAKP